MDLLNDLLATVRLKAGGWLIGDFTAPWGIHVEAGFEEPFFFSVAGSGCWLTYQGNAPINMQQGDLLLVLHGGAYSIKSDVSAREVPWKEVFIRPPWTNSVKQAAPQRLSYGGGGVLTKHIGAVFGFGDRRRHPLLTALPPYIYLSNRDSQLLSILEIAREFLRVEEKHPNPGYVAVAERLAELLFINIIRAHLRLQPEKTTGWVRGLSDPRISRALAAIHQQPGEPWTVSRLAQVATMSRGIFSKRFHVLTGTSPANYLIEWRIYLAAGRFAEGSKSVTTVAEDLGYQSINAFTRAFKRHYGVTPGRYRRSIHSK